MNKLALWTLFVSAVAPVSARLHRQGIGYFVVQSSTGRRELAHALRLLLNLRQEAVLSLAAPRLRISQPLDGGFGYVRQVRWLHGDRHPSHFFSYSGTDFVEILSGRSISTKGFHKLP